MPTSRAERGQRYGMWIAVGAAVLFGLVLLRGEMLAVHHTADTPAHLESLRWAEHRIEDGHSPLDGWLPNLSLGSPQFHQYQSLPHIAGGTLATVFGAPEVLRWSTYLLVACWPLSVLAGMLLFGFDRRTAAIAAVLAPMLASNKSFGYEWSSYLFRGYGLWTQIFGMWLLPIAMGLTWRAIDRGRGYAPAAGVLALTICCHLLTGYVALLFVGVVVAAGAHRFWPRLRRGALIAVGALLIASWLLVPVFVDLKWVGVATQLAPGIRDSYGGRRVVGWLLSGELFDSGRTRLPVVTVFVLIGAVVCIARFRRDARARVLVLFFALNLVLYSGRSTFGALLDLVPGLDDLYLHRFIAPLQFAGLVLAAIGASATWSFCAGVLRGRVDAAYAQLVTVIVLTVGVVVLIPAIVERARYARVNNDSIRTQRSLDRTEGANLDAILARARRAGGGRIYGGTTLDGGQNFKVGGVPVNEAITNAGAPGIGYFGREASLSTDTEILFDPDRRSLYDLFGVRFIIWPSGETPPTPARKVETRGRFTLWDVGRVGYLGVYDTVGPAIHANRGNLLPRTASYVQGSLPNRRATHPIAFGGDAPARPTAEHTSPSGSSPGAVLREQDRPDDGWFAGTVTTSRRAVVVLKESFHRRWHVTVDGEPAPTEMVAPSLVAVTVPAGTHRIVFAYRPFPGTAYALLGLLAVLTLAGLVVIDRRATRGCSPEEVAP